MRLAKRLGLTVLVTYLAAVGGLFVVMHRPILFGQVMKHVPDPAFIVIPFKRLWFAARGGSLKVGDAAPDFNLPTSDKKSYVQLSSLRGHKPVVLIFGSYS